MELGVTTNVVDDRVVLSVSGEIDVATAPQLREELLKAVHEGRGTVVLDLLGVTFLDSTGLGVIVGGLKRARSNDGDLVLVVDNRSILKVLEITGLTRVFSVHATVDDALTAEAGTPPSS